MVGVSRKYFAFAAGLMLVAFLAACGPGGAEKAEGHVKKGIALAAEGKHEAAIAEFKTAAELNRDALDPHILMGDAYRAMKKYDEALAAYGAAKKINRTSPKPHLASALAYLDRGEVEKASGEADQATEVDPGNLAGMILQGRVSMLPRRLPDGGMGVPPVSLERARLNLDAAVQRAPDNVEARYWLAKLYDQIGEKDRALAAWTKLGELANTTPDHAKMASEIAEAIARLKR
ncbi:MAG: tetratricopeptide repeat protein [Rhodospirillales bacterium]|nr:tetratricopeptide repeat protein [Rhodospirillales bacterium]